MSNEEESLIAALELRAERAENKLAAIRLSVPADIRKLVFDIADLPVIEIYDQNHLAKQAKINQLLDLIGVQIERWNNGTS